MSFSSVAEKSFTGIVTRPKEIAPFHIERGMPPSLPDAADSLRYAAAPIDSRTEALGVDQASEVNHPQLLDLDDARAIAS
jgi:hypothetical protein